MAKNNAPAVSVIPVRDDPSTRLLQQIFDWTNEEWTFLQLCSSAPKPTDCTARQRLLFKKLQERDLVTVVEYPCTDGPRWVLSDFGESLIQIAAPLAGVNIGKIKPARILQFPSPR